MATEFRENRRTPDAAGPQDGATPSLSTRLAAWTFAAYVAVALPVVVFGLGSYHWFLRDEWDFLSDRTAGSFHDLLRPHAEHWSTVPVLIYRLEWTLFGFHYAAYQAVNVVLHLTAVVLLRVVMRRAGVQPWIATAAAAVFVLFGPGAQNIVWAFQIGMVGSLVFGLTHLILAGHDGGPERRDWLGLAAGLAGLMCSGIGPVMVGVVGLAVLLRRGWRMAAFHTAPLAAIFLVWYLSYRDEQPKTAPASLRQIVDWLRQAGPSAFHALGHYAVLGGVLAALLVVGVGLAWVPLARSGRLGELRRRAADPAALLLGGVAFVFVTARVRAAFGADGASTSRYLHAEALFALPALAVAADAVVRRWRMALPVVLVALLLPIPGNIKPFDPGGRSFSFDRPFFVHERKFVEGIAWSPTAERVSRSQRPDRELGGGEGPSVGWLLDARRAGRVPNPGPLDTELQHQILIRLAIAQSFGDRSASTAGRTCRTYHGPLDLDPHKGDSFLLQSAIGVRLRDANRPSVFADRFDPLLGRHLRIALPGLHLRLEPIGLTKAFRLCS